jgi:4-amino-4-deoxy-L-arabinose transferase-like glycosyltransferase
MTSQGPGASDKAQRAGIRPWMAVITALLAGNLILLLAPPGPVRTAGALLTLVLSGLAFAEVLLSRSSPLLRWTVGAGLGYAFIIVAGLALANLSGPISRWGILVLADGLSLALVAVLLRSGKRAESRGKGSRRIPLAILLPLALLLVIAGFFRFASLGYSELQGDETEAMVPAARVIEGDPEALMLGRRKGPAEVLLPMLPWRLTESTDEASARLPFALAGVATLATLFLLGRKLGGNPAGLAAAAVAALNGLLIAFSRIVQYQAIVLWMSALAVLCAWKWYERGQTRWAILTGLFTGIGLLAHFDALAVMPVLAYIAVLAFSRNLRDSTSSRRRAWWRDVVFGGLCMMLVVIPFYVPYLLTPQAGVTGNYLNTRIGEGLVKNTIGNFLTYGAFYNSFLYLALTGGLVLAFMAWRVHSAPALRRVPGGRVWAPALLVMIAVALMVWPAGLTIGSVDLASLAWILIFLAAILLPPPSPVVQGTLIWLAVTFIGYNFLLADPRTHFYGIFLPWSLLAGAALAGLWNARAAARWRWAAFSLAAAAAVCFFPFLFDTYLRHDGGLSQDGPVLVRALVWAPEPYATPGSLTKFGMVHRAGWKAIGALYAEGKLWSDFDSNEKPELTAWYVPTAFRLSRKDPAPCSAKPHYYFVADEREVTTNRSPLEPSDLAGYAKIGRVELPNGRGITIYEIAPAGPEIGRVDALALSRDFDRQATPALLTKGPQPSQKANADFGGLIQLTGYDVWQTGGALILNLYWEAIQAPAKDYNVFVHIEGGSEGTGPAGVWGQADGMPACGTSPTGSWSAGDRIIDRHVISPQPDAPAGAYSLVAGLYRLDTGERLPVLDKAGSPGRNDAALGTVTLPLK